MYDTDNEKTMIFSLKDEKEEEYKRILLQVFEAHEERGYDPVERIVNYILTDEPTYITKNKNARSLMCKIDRYELMIMVFKEYLGVEY